MEGGREWSTVVSVTESGTRMGKLLCTVYCTIVG